MDKYEEKIKEFQSMLLNHDFQRSILDAWNTSKYLLFLIIIVDQNEFPVILDSITNEWKFKGKNMEENYISKEE